MIVHLFPQEKFTVDFINFINKNFVIKQHFFIVYGENKTYNKEFLDRIDNVLHINTINKDIIISCFKYISASEKVLLHSLSLPKWLKYYLILRKQILQKSNWIIWGGDLYHYKLRKRSIKSDLDELIRKRIISNLGGIVTHIKGDYHLAKKWYGGNAKYLYSFMYPSNLYKQYNLIQNPNGDESVYIQIGNSADPSNNHIEVFNKLACYKDDKIKIICPLSYGSKKYREEVIKEGRRVFSENFEALTEFLTFEEYLKVLSKVNIAIFNNKRQQAMGNITTLLGLGKKVYIRSDITTWQFTIEHNLKVFDAVKDFSDLLMLMNKDEVNKNIESVEKNFSEEKLIRDLESIFN